MFVFSLFLFKITLPTFPEKNATTFINASTFFNDPPPRSRYAYISGYTSDDSEDHFFILAITCGYSLMKVSPNYDRVLLIPSAMEIPKDKLRNLKSVWTHIIRRPYVQWPDGYKDRSMRDTAFWFKLNAWSVTGWEKLLWTGIDVIFRRDPSTIFNYPAPTSIIDHFVYGFSHLGPVTNGDFLMFKPSLRDFAGMKLLGMNWSRNPDDYGFRLQQQGASWTGPHDQGLISQYFDGNITVAPQWYQLEVPGNPQSILGYNNTDNPDPRVVSFHYPSLFKPWKNNIGPYSNAWANVAQEALNSLNMTYNLRRHGFPPTAEVHHNLKFTYERPLPALPAQIPYTSGLDEGINVKLLFPETLFERRALARKISFGALTIFSTAAIILKTYFDSKFQYVQIK